MFSNRASSTEIVLAARFDVLRGALLNEAGADVLDQPLAMWSLPTDRHLPRALMASTVRQLLDTPFAVLADTPSVGERKLAGLMAVLSRVLTHPSSAGVDGLLANGPLADGRAQSHMSGAGSDRNSADGSRHRTRGNQQPATRGKAAKQSAADRGSQIKNTHNGHAPNGHGHNGNVAVESAPPVANVDEDAVSEIIWSQCCAAILRAGLERETLGRLVVSLSDLPRVCWSTPLETYCRMPLAKVRQMRTHGRKRVQAIIETFRRVHLLLGDAAQAGHLAVRLLPQRIARAEAWAIAVHRLPGVNGSGSIGGSLINAEQLQRHFVSPLLEQLEHDVGSPTAELAVARLGMQAEPLSIAQLAERHDMTRARVYQLLADCGESLAVRWPEGSLVAAALSRRLADRSTPEAAELFCRVQEIFFPER